MKTKFQKVLALVLAMLMLVSVAACAPAGTSSAAGTQSQAGTPSTGTTSTGASSEEDLYYNKTGFPICDETIKVVANGPISDPENPFKDTFLHKHWVENYGIEVDWQMFEGEMWKTQLTTLINSDELPDMLFNSNTTINQAHEYGDEGYFVNWNDYKELAPNTFKRFEDHPDWPLYLTSPNGGIYGLGQYSGWPHEILCRVYMREDWMNNLNLEAPKTVDDVYNVLKAFKEQDANGDGDPNNEIPLVMYGNTYIYCMFLAAFGINVEKANWNLPLVVEDGKVSLAATSENYKAFIEYFIKLYKDGLIDETSFSDTSDEMKAKGATMLVGMHGEVPFLFRSTPIGQDADSITLGGLTSSYNDVKYVGLSYGITSKDVDHIICANSQYKEALIRLLDYYNGDGENQGKGMEEGNAGPWGAEYAEGVTWTYAKDAVTGFNVRDLFREESGVDLEKFNSDEVFRARKATINGLSMFTTIDFIGRGTLYKVESLDVLLSKESLDIYGWAATGEALMRREDVTLVGPTDRYPMMAYTEEESKDSADYGTAVRNLIDTLFVQYVTGQKEFDFDEFKNELNKAGLDKLLAAEQSAYDRYIKNA